MCQARGLLNVTSRLKSYQMTTVKPEKTERAVISHPSHDGVAR